MNEDRFAVDLNPEQLRAVLHGEGPLLVLAGAGSGKTRVITYRIARLVDQLGVDPWHILAVTFTNKAAGEMAERVERLCGRGDVWISTFHSLGARLLRRHAELVGRTPDFVIYDDNDSRRLAESVCASIKVEPDRQRVARLLRKLESCKHRLLDPASDGRLDRVERAFCIEYQRRLERANAFDFADLISQLHRLWRENPDVLDYYRKRFQWVLVDEFQDTDRAQYQLLRLLCPPGANICVVGDDDQAIYNWRDAEVAHILGFERDYPGTVVIRLERNYRSGPHILEAANRVIAENTKRHPKRLICQCPAGEPLDIRTFHDEKEEAGFVALEALRWVEQGGEPEQFAVLYRINALSRTLEEALRLYGVPYRIVGGTRFFDRREVRDLLAYLRLVANPDSDVDFMRVVNIPPRGIGQATVAAIGEVAQDLGCSLLRACSSRELGERLGGKRLAAVREFSASIERFRKELENRSVADLIEFVIAQTGYDSYIEKEDPEGSRIANLYELAKSAEEFAAMTGDGTLGGFLEHVALVTSEDLSAGNGVQLMTLHAAKGLEFDRVYMIGMEEGILPLVRRGGAEFDDGEDKTDIEEERRLCYVGMTRARKKLALSACQYRTLYGSTRMQRPSRFLEAAAAAAVPEGGWDRRPGWLRPESPPSRKKTYRRDEGLFSEDEPDIDLCGDDGWEIDYGDEYSQCASERPDGSAWLGRTVEHSRFGVGRVVGVRPSSQGLKLDIMFEDAGKRVVLDRFVRPC